MVMIKHPLHKNGEFHIDDTLYKNLMFMPRRIELNKDACVLVCGDPGTGKSTLSSQCGFINNPDVIKDNCYFSTMGDYINYETELLKKNESHGKVVFHDEARETGTLNLLNKNVKTFWDCIYENRFLNMYQYIIQSDFFRTPRDIVFNRALFLLWVVEDQDWTNGIFYFFSKRAMIKLYDMGKRQKIFIPRFYDFQGRFVSFWAANPNYLDQKRQNFLDKYTSTNDKELNQYNKLWLRVAESEHLVEPQKCDILDCDRTTLYRRKKKLNSLINPAHVASGDY